MTAFKSKWFVGSSNISKVGSINRALKTVNQVKRIKHKTVGTVKCLSYFQNMLSLSKANTGKFTI